MYRDYGEVAGLESAEQRRVLEKGDSPERLWAAWAITVRLGADAFPMVRDLALSQTTDGLRQQLMVVMAGLGERAALRAFAESDPAARVRATAISYYIRTAKASELVDACIYATSQLRATTAAEVLIAILGEHEVGRIQLPEAAIVPLLDVQNVDVRRAAVLCLFPTGTAPHAAVVHMLREESDVDLRQLVVERIARADVPAVLQLLAGGSRAREVLVVTRRRFGSLGWTELSGFIHDVEAATPVIELDFIDTAIEALTLPAPDEAIPWLSRSYEYATTQQTPMAARVLWRATSALLSSLSQTNVASLDASVGKALRREVQDHLAHFKIEGWDGADDPEYLEELSRLERLASLLSGAA